MYTGVSTSLRRFFAIALNIRLMVCLTVATPFGRMACKVKSWLSHFLLQLRVLRLGLLQDGNVWVGVFPKCEEVLVGGPSLRTISLEGVGAGQTETGQRAQRGI